MFNEFGSTASPVKLFNPNLRTMALKSYEERIIAVQEEFELHLEFYQRGVTDELRVSWNFLFTWREVKLAKEIDESTLIVVDHVAVSLMVEQKAPRNVSWRHALNIYAERFNVGEVSGEMQVNWKEYDNYVFNASAERQKCLKFTGEQVIC